MSGATALLLYLLTISAILYYSKDIFVKLWYILIFVYTFVTYFAYVFFPDVFAKIHVDLLGDKSVEYGAFLILSTVASFVVYKFLESISNGALEFGYAPNWILFDRIVLLGGGIFILVVALYFVSHNNDFMWGTGGKAMGGSAFTFFFRFVPLLVLLSVWRILLSELKLMRFLHAGLSLAALALFLAVTVRSGTRSEIVYFMIGLFLLLVVRFNISGRLVVLSSIIGIVILFVGSQSLLVARPSGPVTFASLVQGFQDFMTSFSTDGNSLRSTVFGQDYFAPSASLPMSIEKDLVIPWEVIGSDLANSVPFTHQSTMSDIVSAAFGLKFERGAGLAYFIYTQGYNLFGFLGFIYNGVIGGGLLYLIQFGYLKSSRTYKSIFLAVSGYFMLNFLRNQTGTIFRIGWTQWLPVIVFLLLIFRWKIERVRRPSTSVG